VRTDLVLDQADDLLHHGRAGRAATLLTPVVGREPDNVGAWQLMTRARLQLGQLDQALVAARSALRADPRAAESLYWVSAAYTALGRHDLAIAAASTACAEDPGNPRLAERRGRALLAAGRTGDAELILRTAVEFAHYDAALHVAHGIALFAVGRPLSAREAYGRALRLEPGNARARTELRRLTRAERSIVDAGSLVRVTDDFAESLRIRAGGRRTPVQAGILRHFAAVVLVVCLAALIVLGVVGLTGGAEVPAALTGALLCACAGAAAPLLLRRA
jgi:Flp pilus assembly protein TadD